MVVSVKFTKANAVTCPRHLSNVGRLRFTGLQRVVKCKGREPQQ